MQTTWFSPTDFVTGDSTLQISYPSAGHPSTIVTCTTPGDLKWISLGLRLPSDVSIEEVTVCYQVSNPQSFISQVRLVEMDTPNQVTVRHDDPTDLKSTSPTCYASIVARFVPHAAVTLELRLNFGANTDQILLGAIGIKTRAIPRRWPSADSRMDTALAYFSAALDPDEFNNIVGMPILLQVLVNRVEGLKQSQSVGGAHEFTYYVGYRIWNGQLVEFPHQGQLTQDQSKFVKKYYPGFFASPSPSMAAQYRSFREHLRANNPAQHIGSNLSGSYCQDTPSSDIFPAAVIDCDALALLGHKGLIGTEARETASKYLDDWKTWYVNPTAQTSNTAFEDSIVNEAVARDVSFLFLDNMHFISYVRPTHNDEADSLEAFIRHIRALSKRLNAMGYGAIYNLGKLPDWPTDFKEYPYLEHLFDTAIGDNGIYLEAPFRYRDSSARTEWEMLKLQSLLAQGALVVLSPSPEGYGDPARAEWMAAMALVTREWGDPLFVATASGISTNHWRDWPSLYGPPIGQAPFVRHDANNWSVKRSFTNGEVTVVHISASGAGARVPIPVSTTGYQVVFGPKLNRGTFDSTHNEYVVDSSPNLDPNADDGYSDRFILGANPDATHSWYHDLIAVDVIIESHNFR